MLPVLDDVLSTLNQSLAHARRGLRQCDVTDDHVTSPTPDDRRHTSSVIINDADGILFRAGRKITIYRVIFVSVDSVSDIARVRGSGVSQAAWLLRRLTSL